MSHLSDECTLRSSSGSPSLPASTHRRARHGEAELQRAGSMGSGSTCASGTRTPSTGSCSSPPATTRSTLQIVGLCVVARSRLADRRNAQRCWQPTDAMSLLDARVRTHTQPTSTSTGPTSCRSLSQLLPSSPPPRTPSRVPPAPPLRVHQQRQQRRSSHRAPSAYPSQSRPA